MAQTKLLSARLLAMYLGTFVFLAALATLLVWDLNQERRRAIDGASRLVVQKSQFMERSFDANFLATDYVLRDVLGRIHLATDLLYPDPDPAHLQRVEAMLKEKAATVPFLEDIGLMGKDCRFVAFATGNFYGRKSRQRFCADPKNTPVQDLYIQYLPAEQAANKRPSLLISRVLRSPDGRMQGGAFAVMDVAYVQTWVSTFKVDQHDVLAVLDTADTLLARNPPLPGTVGRSATQPANARALTRVNTFVAVSPLDSRERIYGVSKLERFPFVVLVGFDKETVLANWQSRVWLVVVGYVALLILSLLVLRAHVITLHQGEALRTLATTDALTSMANRRHLMARGAQEVGRAQRYGTHVSALMLDIDYFKNVNDTWGHPAGDRVIQALAKVMRSVIREQDAGGRMGGEEFAVVLPETGLEDAQIMAERLRAAVEASTAAASDQGEPIRCTVSIGVATLTREDADFEALLQRADKALYRAKERGRNRVEALSSEV